MKQLTRHITFSLLFVGLMVTAVGAQTLPDDQLTYDFRGESLERVLDRIARDSGIDLVYDPVLVRNKDVFKRLNNQAVSEVLRQILTDHDLDYIILSSGTVVIIKRAADVTAYGTLSGIIVDSRTGEPLPGATVMLADAAGGTSTGQMGQFSINRLMSGEHTLIFSYVGYRAVTKTIRIQPDGLTRETIELQPRPVDVAPIVVEAHRPQIYRLDMSQADNAATYEYDSWTNTPISDLSIIPGVRSGISSADITLQGGQDSEHRFRLDGAPLYNTGSLNRLFSSFSPYAIGTIEVQRAGYEAKVGSQIAGLIDLSHDMSYQSDRGVMLQADPLSLNARGNITHRFDDESSLSVMSLFRTNIWGVYQDPVLEQTLREWDVIDPLITNSTSDIINNAEVYFPFDHQSDLSFHDFHTTVSYKPSRYHRLNLSLYDSGNSLETAVLNRSLQSNENDDRPYLYAAESYEWDNRMAQLSWNSIPTSRLSIGSQISYSYSRFRHRSELGYGIPNQFLSNTALNSVVESDGFQFDRVELPADIQGNEIGHWIAKSDINFSLTPTSSIEGGLQLDYVQTSLATSDEFASTAFSDIESFMAAGHLSGNFRFGRYWHVNAGGRLTYDDGGNQLFAEPRMSIQLDRPDSRIGYWSAKVSGGLYRQFINEYRVSNSGAASVVPSFSIWSHAGTLPVPKAWHLTGSWYVEPSDNSSLRVEGYLKWQPVTSITSYRTVDEVIDGETETSVQIFGETTSMNASGVGFRYRRSMLASKLTLIAGYDFSFTSIDMDTQFGRSVGANWNDPHRAQIRAVWGVTSDLTLIGKWQGIWGRRWAYRDSYYSYLQLKEPETTQQFDFGSPDDDQLPHFSQVDVSAVYKPSIGSTSLELRLDLINVLNRRNPIDRYLRPLTLDGSSVRYQSTYRKLPGFYPSVSIKVTI